MDEDFLHAYRHGIIIKCADGVLRRVFPRIFTYSADYPEKYVFVDCLTISSHSAICRVLIATIKDMGLCPCPRCLTPKSFFSFLGLPRDMKRRMTNVRSYVMARVVEAREFIHSGSTVDGVKVEHSLGEGSWVPVLVSTTTYLSIDDFVFDYTTCSQNTFVEKLGPFGLDAFRMLVVDFMHECELGTWKALFSHLIRLLYAIPGGNQLVATLDQRYKEFT